MDKLNIHFIRRQAEELPINILWIMTDQQGVDYLSIDSHRTLPTPVTELTRTVQ